MEELFSHIAEHLSKYLQLERAGNNVSSHFTDNINILRILYSMVLIWRVMSR